MTGLRGADLLFRGGSVWTGAPGDARAAALAARDGRVLAVGSEAEVSAAVGRAPRVVELEGRTLLPGFVDAHTHFLLGGTKLSGVDLRGASTPGELARRIGDFAAQLRPGEWITGGDWDHERWGGELPRAEWIDALTPGNPVFVNRTDAHMALANSLALAAGGVDAGTADPAGGQIVREPVAGTPTGILKDAAMALVSRAVPPPGAAELERGLEAATRHALSLGVTQVHDMGPLLGGSWAHLETYERRHAAGALGVRVYCLVPLETWEAMAARVAERGTGDDRLRWGGVKGFVDGSLGSATAWFHAPYADVPGTCGLTVTDLDVLCERILGADAAGLHVVVHAIGDRANDWLLDAYRVAASRNGPRDRRFRVEHAQHLSPGAARRFAEQRVIASVQPYHLVDDGPWAERRIGPERARTTYAFRSLLDAGATLAFGSDWTVAPMDPLPALAAAVTRRAGSGGDPQGWVPEQRIALEEGLRAHTWGGAYAGFAEGRTGGLHPGALADLVLLSGDLFAAAPEEITSLRVDATYLEGEEVFRRGG
jgi:predicted amidohydrolase YtcJ